jgi:PhnB protein
MKSTDIYLFFNGNCEAAFEFYQTVFNTTATYSRFGDSPDGGPSAEDSHLIMNASMPLGENNILMGCDNPSVSHSISKGNNFYVVANTSTKEEATEIFGKLSAEGSVHFPLEDTFWGAYFGMLIDKFGISWMVSFRQ